MITVVGLAVLGTTCALGLGALCALIVFGVEAVTIKRSR